jgi:predicted RNase H-like HicB family nuclease
VCLYNAIMRQVVIYRDHEDGGWVVEVPSLPGCVSEGQTKAQALENVRDAIEGWLEAAKELGMAAPEDGLDAELHLVESGG